MKQFLCFAAAIAGWTLIGRAVLELGILPPVVLFIIWLGGFVWLAGRIAGSSADANHMLKVTLGFFGVCGLLAAIVVLATS